MDIVKVITGAVSIILGLVMLPVVAFFVYQVSYNRNSTGQWNLDDNVTSISGLSSVVNLVGYGFAFSLVGIGIGLIYIGWKE